MNILDKLKSRIDKTGSTKIIFALLAAAVILSSVLTTRHLLVYNSIGRIVKVVMLLIFSLFIVKAYTARKFTFHLDEKLVILYTLFALISGLIIHQQFNSENIGLPLEFMLTYLGITAYFRLTSDNNNYVKYLYPLFIILSVIHITAAFYPSPYTWTSFGWRGLFDLPNNYGQICMSGIIALFIIFFYHIERRDRTVPIIAIILILAALYALFMSKSRGAFLGLGVYISITLVLFIIYKKYTLLHRNMYIILMLTSVITIVLLVKTGTLQAFIAKFDQGTTYRSDFWLTFIKNQLHDFPGKSFFFGKGYGVHSINPVPDEFGRGLHNYLLDIWGRFGLFPLLIIMTLLSYISLATIKSKTLWFIAAVPISYVVHGMIKSTITISTLNLSMLFFFFTLAHILHHSRFIEGGNETID